MFVHQLMDILDRNDAKGFIAVGETSTEIQYRADDEIVRRWYFDTDGSLIKTSWIRVENVEMELLEAYAKALEYHGADRVWWNDWV